MRKNLLYLMFIIGMTVIIVLGLRYWRGPGRIEMMQRHPDSRNTYIINAGPLFLDHRESKP